jgi:hypothetical protein
MITLAGSCRLGSSTVFRDVLYRDGQRRYTPRFYVLPDAPRLSRDGAGRPAFDFLWYRSGLDAGTAPSAGGLVTLTVELAPSPEERAQIVEAIPAALAPEALPSIDIVAVPFVSGTVTLSFAGESADGEFATRVAGNGPARLVGAERATFVVELSRDGAALLWGAIEDGRDLFHVRYDLVFEHRLDDIELRVWSDARRCHEVAAARLRAGSLDGRQLTEAFVAERLAGVELSSPRPLADEHRRTLERLGQSLLEASLVGALFDAEAGASTATTSGLSCGDRTLPLRPYTDSLQATLNHTFKESYPVEQHAVLSDVLRLEASREQLGERLRLIDLDGGFFRVLEVPIHCTVDFARDLVAAVTARVEYDATGPSGRVHRTGEFLFRDGEPMHTFRTELASHDSRSYRYDVDVYYRGEPHPARIAYPKTDADAIVLDLDGLGVLDVAVELGDVPLDAVRAAVVDLEYPSKGLSHRLILDGEHPGGSWRVAVRERPAPYRYRIAWVTVDDRRIEGEWQSSSQRRVWLKAPRNLIEAARVQVIGAGEFTGLAQIVVDLRTTSEAEPQQAQVAFSGPGETWTWQPRVADRLAFRYQARRTLVYQDGTVRELPWTDEDRPVLVVRDELRADVRIVSRLLDLGGAWQSALLFLESLGDGDQSDQQATLVLKDRDAELAWTVRLGTPGRPRYRYQLTLIPAHGPRKTLPWQESQDAILVLRPAEE